MSKNDKPRYKLSEVHDQYVDAVGGENVEFEVAEGKVFHFPHPVFADEDWAKAVDAARSVGEKVRAILGDEQYVEFKKAGGRDADVNLLLRNINEQTNGQIVGVDVRPTRS